MFTRKSAAQFVLIGSISLALGAAAYAESSSSDNLGIRVKRLLAATQEQGVVPDATHHRLTYNAKAGRYELGAGKRNILFDDQKRVLVRIVLDGVTSSDSIEKEVTPLGGKLVAKNQLYHEGVVSAYLPIDQIKATSVLPGVKALHLESAPILNVGSVTSQGVEALKVNKAFDAGYRGKGVTIGVISDSFNITPYQGNPDTALSDVLSGDLPNTKKLFGEEGLKFAIDDDEYEYDTDEGRAMAQIVHDMAPAADLCFATAELGQQAFAEFIVDLRTDPACGADIVVDDAYYFEEPFYSDGPIARAIDLATESTTLPGKPISYFSAAGNDNGSGSYTSLFRPVSLATAKKLPNLPIDLSTIPATVPVGGGFQNFNSDPNGPVVIAQQIQAVGSNPIVLEWDDLFDRGLITTDYNLLVFDSNGKYDANLSSVENNFITDEPAEFVDLEASTPTTYYFVITRGGGGTHEAKQLKFVDFSDGGGQLVGPYLSNGLSAPLIVGHAAATDTIAVAAYVVNRAPFTADPPYTPEIESYSSAGPGYVAFEGTTRLAENKLRQKPNVACVDGVFTTFFGGYTLPSDEFPRFYGTSAAAPCAAGIGALLLEKSQRPGGPGAIRHLDMVNILKASGTPRSLDPFEIPSIVDVGDSGFLGVVVDGTSENIQSPTEFSVYFLAPGKTLSSLTLNIPDVDNAIFLVDSTSADGSPFPFLSGPSSPGVSVKSTSPSDKDALVFAQSFTLNFNGFHSGDFFDFGLDRIDPVLGYFDDTADRLNGTTYTATFSDGTKVTGALTQTPRHIYSIYDGHGLIDAESAINLVH